MKRGKKSRVVIAGHTLTYAEVAVLRQVQDFMEHRKVERQVSLSEIFPAEIKKRYCARHLAEVGVLAAVGIAWRTNDSVNDVLERTT